MQNSDAFLYTSKKLPKREIKKTIPFIIASKRIKYLGTNLTKVVKDLWLKSVRHWWKKLKKTQINENIFCAYELKELIWWKYPYNR